MRVPKRVNWKREDDIFAKLLRKHNVERVDGSAVSPYCVRAEIPFSNDEDVVRNFANELFHEVGALDADDDIDFGEMTDYCRLDKDDEDGCYYVAFNHHTIIGLKPGDDGYEYSVTVEFGDSEDSGDEFGEWNDDDVNCESVATIKRPSAKRRAEIEKQIADVMDKYRVAEMVGEINPYCYNVQVKAYSADEMTIVEAFNDMFHTFGVLPEDEMLDVGGESDYCEIYKTDDAYFAPFNDPLIIGVGADDKNYKYILKKVRANMRVSDEDVESNANCCDVDYGCAQKEAERGMRSIANSIKSGVIRASGEEGKFVIGSNEIDAIGNGGVDKVVVDFNPTNLANSIGIKTASFKKSNAKATMQFDVKSVGLLDADDRECDPYNIPDGFIATTIAIHLGKRIG